MDEYYDGQLSTNLDVFSFGVVSSIYLHCVCVRAWTHTKIYGNAGVGRNIYWKKGI